MTVEYEYAAGNLLEDRNTYFYTPYHGPEFLAAWRRSRDAILQDLPAATEPPPASERHVRAIQADATPTEFLLEIMMANLDRDGECPLLDRLIQRFEVTKRIHRAYDANWRPQDRDAYHDLGLYLRFAELLAAAYARNDGLPRLNALIKVIDTLVAMRDRLKPGQAARLASVIAAERTHVERLEAGLQE